ncbi:hypothetical protein GCM10008090_31130 [Arenicella chitinivorans]|uniref:Uncharacterized protein n=1 Tax=Arenicella chitinivorans TaxID=1329800 RepID=A0A918VQB9_9GAMM|nr:hypothetical protein [Arenicella chitinivorans]GHA19125.1 hypothetical protein GCM10008090_31130 [Arenicella chitinivorans]
MTYSVQQGAASVFYDGIEHPDYFLWDAWSYEQDGILHLYSLAVERILKNGVRLQPHERNNVPFHVRHFSSSDHGESWHDLGCFQEPRPALASFDARTVWSSSMTLLADQRKLVAFTGLAEQGSERPFLQSMAMAFSSDGNAIDADSIQLISSPVTDWEEITAAGYYLAERANLGHKDGEDGGPILAWRDPYVLEVDGDLHLFWCAKADRMTPALGHAKLNAEYQIDTLYPPTRLPDDNGFTQFELPKVYHDSENQQFYLIGATCNRLYEGQSDAEVDKQIRMYVAESVRGPWRPHSPTGSSLGLGAKHMFGMTVLRADFSTGELLCIAPYTEAADKPLTFSAPFTIKLNPEA